MDEVSERSWPRGIDWAFLLALATPIAYLMAYRFNVGYLEHFGIPSTLVDVALKEILYTTAIMLSVGYTAYLFVDGFLVFLPESWPKSAKRGATLLFIIGIAVMFVLAQERAGWLAWSIAALLCLLAALLVTHLRKSVEDSAEMVVRPDPYAHKGIIPALMRIGVKREIILAGFTVLVLSNIMKPFGGIAAMWTTDHLIYQSVDGVVCAVIRARDSDLLCADFERSTGKLKGTYRFLNPESTVLSVHKGRLQGPEQTKSSSKSSRS